MQNMLRRCHTDDKRSLHSCYSSKALCSNAPDAEIITSVIIQRQ
uniref:Uncharacterized protein n=1 Tax=Anguilla anguilla TaxID=7936 RepID=A0A0E9TAI4_ANGAN